MYTQIIRNHISHFGHTSTCLVLSIKTLSGSREQGEDSSLGDMDSTVLYIQSLTSRLTLDLHINFNLGIWCRKGLGNGEYILFSQSEVFSKKIEILNIPGTHWTFLKPKICLIHFGCIVFFFFNSTIKIFHFPMVVSKSETWKNIQESKCLCPRYF